MTNFAEMIANLANTKEAQALKKAASGLKRRLRDVADDLFRSRPHKGLFRHVAFFAPVEEIDENNGDTYKHTLVLKGIVAEPNPLLRHPLNPAQEAVQALLIDEVNGSGDLAEWLPVKADELEVVLNGQKLAERLGLQFEAAVDIWLKEATDPNTGEVTHEAGRTLNKEACRLVERNADGAVTQSFTMAAIREIMAKAAAASQEANQ